MAEPGPELRTERLLLRRWLNRDREPFAALNADPETMRFMPRTLTGAESGALIDELEARFEANGYGLWAVELGDGALAGFVGLNPVPDELPPAPAVEVGWRLARTHWGRGYATEAAKAAVGFGFERLGLGEIVSFTSTGNERSRAVMERLGMRRDEGGDFDHPGIPSGDDLRPHVLYRLAAGAA